MIATEHGFMSGARSRHVTAVLVFIESVIVQNWSYVVVNYSSDGPEKPDTPLLQYSIIPSFFSIAVRTVPAEMDRRAIAGRPLSLGWRELRRAGGETPR